MKTKSKTKNMNRIWIGIGIAMVALLLAGGIVSAATGLTIPTILIADQNGNAKQIFNAGDQIRLGVYVNNPSTSPDSVTLTSSIIYGNGNTIITNAPYTVTIPGKSTPGWYWADTIPSNAPAGIYYYKVTASDSLGSVTQMAVFQIKNVVTVTVPASPTGLSVGAVDGTSIRMSWKDNSNNEVGFEISNGDTSVKIGANTNSYTWGGLTPGKYMCFMVRAYNAAGSSAYTPYACTTTVAVPPVPTGISASALDSTSIRVSWNDNSNNEVGFEISNGDTSVKVGANTNSYTWGGLTPGKYMCFQVRAYNSAGSSGFTPYACTTTLTSPPPPNNVKSSHAIAWATGQINNPTPPPPLKSWNGYCEKFVEYAFGNYGGTGTHGFLTPQAAYSALHASSSGSPNIGSLVFFVPNQGNYGYGHVGIYIGNGQFISATSNGVKPNDLNSWSKNVAAYEGWVDAPANWPGR